MSKKDCFARLALFTAALGLLLAATSASQAAPILSVDMDPTIAGLQSTRTVVQGDMFDVDIIIDGVEAAAPLNAFQLTLSGDMSLISANSVVLGSFLLAPSITVINSVVGASATIGGATLLPAGATGDGILATVSFTADAIGITSLELSSVTLSAPFGVPIGVEGLVSGRLTIESDPSLLSAPPALSVILLGGLATLVGARRRRAQR